VASRRPVERPVELVALLRAVNLGSHNKVPMAVLKPLITDLGYTDVATYIQSGNVWLTNGDTEQRVAEAVHDAIAAQFNLDIAVIVRPVRELQGLCDANPYLDDKVDVGRLGVTFFAPGADEAALAAAAARYAPDVMTVQGRNGFVYVASGFGTTKLTNAWLERIAGVPATTRNWKTVVKLAAGP
jgi:uncharacterized protein (DUF1697 family)